MKKSTNQSVWGIALQLDADYNMRVVEQMELVDTEEEKAEFEQCLESIFEEDTYWIVYCEASDSDKPGIKEDSKDRKEFDIPFDHDARYYEDGYW